LDLHSASSLKQQSADRHVAPLGHIILISSQPVCSYSLMLRSYRRSNKYKFYSLPSGATCLSADCCFSELALCKSNSACLSRTKRTSSSYHWKLTCFRHDIAVIAELALNNNHSLTLAIVMNFFHSCPFLFWLMLILEG
jgi:hypothetical protein